MKPSKQALNEAKSIYVSGEDTKVYKSVKEHYTDSWDNVVNPNTASFEEKEAMLLGSPLDSMTASSKSSVFDPRLATIVLERAARVMSQNPSGKALAMSKDDRGKNMLMNLLMDKWVLPNANGQFQFLTKMRMWDMYSLVYGAYFALVDRVSSDVYSGPDIFLLPIRTCRPQPNKFSVNDSNWFGVSNWVTPEFLKTRNTNTWRNVDQLLMKFRDGTGNVKGDNTSAERTFIERQRQPSTVKDKRFKTIEIYTEYQKDRWITIAPEFNNMVLRNIENPHGDDQLPIVAKYSFPLMDSIYGLGEFERGKTLQYAINSLINLYLDGVKFSIFPPLMLDADGIVPSSIIMEPAAKWLMTKPNAISQLPINPQGISTFQATYSFLVAALLNQAGTTDTTVSEGTDPGQGKTPQALAMVAGREQSRDNWDRYMMEESLEQVMGKFVNLTANGIDKPVELRLFAKEIQEIQQVYPDVVDMVDGSERGAVKISSKQFKNTKFDYEITKGSTYKVDHAKEMQNTTNIMDFTIKNLDLLNQSLGQKGKAVDVGELYQRWIISSGVQDWDKIIVDSPQLEQGQTGPMGQMQPEMMGGQMPPEMMGQMPMNPMQQMPMEQMQSDEMPMQEQGIPRYQDPEIDAFARQMFGGGK